MNDHPSLPLLIPITAHTNHCSYQRPLDPTKPRWYVPSIARPDFVVTASARPHVPMIEHTSQCCITQATIKIADPAKSRCTGRSGHQPTGAHQSTNQPCRRVTVDLGAPHQAGNHGGSNKFNVDRADPYGELVPDATESR